jgi:hypothetical protein
MVEALKAFRTYAFLSKIIAYMPTSVVKDMLVQLDSDRKRGRWLARIQEFDLEVKLTKLVKGQGLTNLLEESNFKAIRINHLESRRYIPDIEELDDQTTTIQIKDKFSSSAWYRNIVSYLLSLQMT